MCLYGVVKVSCISFVSRYRASRFDQVAYRRTALMLLSAVFFAATPLISICLSPGSVEAFRKNSPVPRVVDHTFKREKGTLHKQGVGIGTEHPDRLMEVLRRRIARLTKLFNSKGSDNIDFDEYMTRLQKPYWTAKRTSKAWEKWIDKTISDAKEDKESPEDDVALLTWTDFDGKTKDVSVLRDHNDFLWQKHLQYQGDENVTIGHASRTGVHESKDRQHEIARAVAELRAQNILERGDPFFDAMYVSEVTLPDELTTLDAEFYRPAIEGKIKEMFDESAFDGYDAEQIAQFCQQMHEFRLSPLIEDFQPACNYKEIMLRYENYLGDAIANNLDDLADKHRHLIDADTFDAIEAIETKQYRLASARARSVASAQLYKGIASTWEEDVFGRKGLDEDTAVYPEKIDDVLNFDHMARSSLLAGSDGPRLYGLAWVLAEKIYGKQHNSLNAAGMTISSIYGTGEDAVSRSGWGNFEEFFGMGMERGQGHRGRLVQRSEQLERKDNTQGARLRARLTASSLLFDGDDYEEVELIALAAAMVPPYITHFRKSHDLRLLLAMLDTIPPKGDRKKSASDENFPREDGQVVGAAKVRPGDIRTFVDGSYAKDKEEVHGRANDKIDYLVDRAEDLFNETELGNLYEARRRLGEITEDVRAITKAGVDHVTGESFIKYGAQIAAGLDQSPRLTRKIFRGPIRHMIAANGAFMLHPEQSDVDEIKKSGEDVDLENIILSHDASLLRSAYLATHNYLKEPNNGHATDGENAMSTEEKAARFRVWKQRKKNRFADYLRWYVNGRAALCDVADIDADKFSFSNVPTDLFEEIADGNEEDLTFLTRRFRRSHNTFVKAYQAFWQDDTVDAFFAGHGLDPNQFEHVKELLFKLKKVLGFDKSG